MLMKRPETLALERLLEKQCIEKRIYGAEEITIGFYNSGGGDEICDYVTMDSHGVLRCYEIKVTLQDLKSDAKLSFYGHYNYLVVTPELYKKVENWDDYIESHVGIIIPWGVVDDSKDMWRYLQVSRKPKKVKLELEKEVMLKESMIRSMFYKMQKYKHCNDPQKLNAYKSANSRLSNEVKRERARAIQAENIINKYESMVWFLENREIDLADEGKRMEKLWQEKRKERKA